MAEQEKYGGAGAGSGESGKTFPAPLWLDLEGYEGSLDVMLHLAQTKKLDLSKISVLALAAQYLRFIRQADALDLAGEYLLMAAALIYMKSRLALPQEKQEQDEAEDGAEKLLFRLNRLAALRAAAEQLFQRQLLGAGIFACGAPQEICMEAKTEYQADLAGLLSAYAQMENRRRKQKLSVGRAPIFWPLAEARQAVMRLLTASLPQGADKSGGKWLNLPEALAGFAAPPAANCAAAQRSVQAGGFAAVLELARQGKAELRQEQAFCPLYARAVNKAAPA